MSFSLATTKHPNPGAARPVVVALRTTTRAKAAGQGNTPAPAFAQAIAPISAVVRAEERGPANGGPEDASR